MTRRHGNARSPVRPPSRSRLTTGLVGAVIAALVATVAPTPALAEVWLAEVEKVPVAVGPTGGTVTRNDIEPFDTIAVSWRGPETAAPTVTVGHGGTPDAIEPDPAGPDSGPDDSAHESSGDDPANFTEPVWVGSANSWTLDVPAGTTDVTVHLVRQHRDLVARLATPPAGAETVPGDGPAVQPRSAWAAAPPAEQNSVARSVRFAVVHHTVTANNYAASDIPSILRSIQAFHQQSRGWNDIAYNFLVDRFGGIWEGRAGGIDRPVVGAHAANFNTGTVGVSLLGDFTSTEPSPEAIAAAGELIGWKLALHGVNPRGTTTVTGTADNVFPDGQTVTIPTVVGHRDVGQTSCPGRVWNHLDEIRDRAGQRPAYVAGRLEGATLASVSPPVIRVSGFALDRRSASPIRVVSEINGSLSTDARADQPRPDVAAFGLPPNTGFGFDVAVRAGSIRMCLYGADAAYGALTPLGCSTISVPDVVTPHDPVGGIDSLSNSGLLASLNAWVGDPDTADRLVYVVTVNGRLAAGGFADTPRPDLAGRVSSPGVARGLSTSFVLDPGPNKVCLAGVNVGAGSTRPVECRDVAYDPAPVGMLDTAAVRGGQLTVSGWAIDRDTTGPVGVLVIMRQQIVGGALAQAWRPALGAFFPGYGDTHGYDITVPMPRGTHDVCTLAGNIGAGPPAVILGCATVRR